MSLTALGLSSPAQPSLVFPPLAPAHQPGTTGSSSGPFEELLHLFSAHL